jgi:glycosyltransferase involved in cell wall biosynthesis
MKNKKRIGIITYWGFGRGQAYLSLCHAKMMLPEYDVFILQQGENHISSEFNIDVSVTKHKEYNIEPEFFKKWIADNNLDAVLFNEYNQWEALYDNNNLLKIARDLNVRVYGWLVTEKFSKKEDYKDYDYIFASTNSMQQFFRQEKIRNFKYIPYSLDLKEFPIIKKGRNEKFTFFHPGGFGGAYERKATGEVIRAFLELNNPNTKLIITMQRDYKIHPETDNIEVIDRNLSRKELLELYTKADAVILPSKWESIGLPILESLASYTPVITNNIPPMNEFVREGLNGYLCKVGLKKYSDISVFAGEVDITSLNIKMQNVMNELLHPILCRNSRYVVEQLYDIEKNKHYMLDFLKEDLGE